MNIWHQRRREISDELVASLGAVRQAALAELPKATGVALWGGSAPR